MAARMIRVRNRATGDVTRVSERAYGYFAAHFERLDQPDTPPASQAAPVPAPAPAVEPAQPKPAVRRPAASNDKE